MLWLGRSGIDLVRVQYIEIRENQTRSTVLRNDWFLYCRTHSF